MKKKKTPSKGPAPVTGKKFRACYHNLWHVVSGSLNARGELVTVIDGVEVTLGCGQFERI